MQFSRLLSVLCLTACCFFSGRSASAQGFTNVITLCTDNDLVFAFESGGEYFMDCGTNIVSIALSEPLIASRNITIRTTNEVVITGQNLTRILVIEPGVKVTLEGFAFFSGRQTETNLNHGGIEDTAGGAIYNNGGFLSVHRGRFQANAVVGITGAPAEDDTGDPGESGGDAAGAAIYNNAGTVVVSNVVFAANSATGGVGGNGGNGRTSGFGDSGGNGGQGGTGAGAAIYSNGGKVEVYACTFTNNTAIGAAAGAGGSAGSLLGFPGHPGEAGDGVGGAIAGGDANISIYASTFITNSVRGANGFNGNAGVGRNDGDQGLNGGEGAGGAIYSTGTLSVTNSTFFRNGAISGNGGAGGAGSASGFGFSGGDGGNGGTASGGAIESLGRASIIHCTFADNGVTSGNGGAGGAGTGLGDQGDAGAKGTVLGAAIHGAGNLQDDPVTLANSIFVNSRPSISGASVRDVGGNIATDRNSLFTSTNSFSPANPFLQALANNGGPTRTMRIGTNSIAVDRGVAAYCVPFDQRGTNRIGMCDIGAFEFIPPPQLGVIQGTNSIVLSWPVGNSNLFVQMTTNLLKTNTLWTTITNASIGRTNIINYFTVTPNPRVPRSFFRLFDKASAEEDDDDVPVPPSP